MIKRKFTVIRFLFYLTSYLVLSTEYELIEKKMLETEAATKKKKIEEWNFKIYELQHNHY